MEGELRVDPASSSPSRNFWVGVQNIFLSYHHLIASEHIRLSESVIYLCLYVEAPSIACQDFIFSVAD